MVRDTRCIIKVGISTYTVMYTVLQMAVFVGDGDSWTCMSRDGEREREREREIERERERVPLWGTGETFIMTVSCDVIKLHAE